MAGYRALCLALALAAPTLAAGQEPGLNIELNRMDARGEGCRVHVVVTNKDKVAYTGFVVATGHPVDFVIPRELLD